MLLYPTDFIADFHAIIMYQPVLLNGYIAPPPPPPTLALSAPPTDHRKLIPLHKLYGRMVVSCGGRGSRRPTAAGASSRQQPTGTNIKWRAESIVCPPSQVGR